MLYPPAAFRNVRKTWVSGMSPVAAEAASPDNAPGPEPAGGEELVEEGFGVLARLEEEPEEEPHAAAVAAIKTDATRTISVRGMGAMFGS